MLKCKPSGLSCDDPFEPLSQAAHSLDYARDDLSLFEVFAEELYGAAPGEFCIFLVVSSG